MESGQFYLHLPSNSSMGVFPLNTLTEYRVQLPQRMRLSGDWEVALTELQYPHSWKNVREEDNWNRIYFEDVSAPDEMPKICIVAVGHYTSLESVIQAINQQLGPNFKNIRLTYDKLSRKVTLKAGPNIKCIFNEIGEMLGFESNKLYTGTVTAPREADLENGFHNLYIYCDVIQAQLVGDSQVPLLRIVPVEGNDGERVTRAFVNPQYLPVSRSEFDTLEVNIKRDTGEKVPFETGRVLVTLHF